ncbi:hypothetical protein F5883DRAFT_586046 [Diaporthe sp. PMI_573]|nr:hypothetical protein F5883DRAFT_586046 [Diaporthaceae sp. PMI_573]
MASSSQQPADCTSKSQTSIDPAVDAESIPSEVLNFDCIFRATYPNKGQLGPSGNWEIYFMGLDAHRCSDLIPCLGRSAFAPGPTGPRHCLPTIPGKCPFNTPTTNRFGIL